MIIQLLVLKLICFCFRSISQTIRFLLAALPFNGLHQEEEPPAAAAAQTIHGPFFIRALASPPLLVAVAATSTALSFEWLLDSGASFCVTGNLELLQGLHCADLITATVANGQQISSTKCGRAVGAVNLSGIRYFPGATANLISTGFLVRHGCEIRENIHGVEIWKSEVLVGRGRLLSSNLWSVDSLDDIHLGEPPACPFCPDPHWMLTDD